MIRTPRDAFIASGHRVKLEELVQTPAFEAACHYALLTLMDEAPEKFRDMSDSWQSGVYMAGARRVIELLSTLHKAEKPPEKPKPRTLNYTV